MKRLFLLLTILVFLPLQSFGETETCFCNYTTYSDESGSHDVKGKFTLTFIIDRMKGVAYIVGNQGSAEVMFLPSEMGGVTFIEITDTGNVMTTSIDSKNNSVHSRNTVINGEIVPTQYYGKCQCR
jgi:hypothetical protein